MKRFSLLTVGIKRRFVFFSPLIASLTIITTFNCFICYSLWVGGREIFRRENLLSNCASTLCLLVAWDCSPLEEQLLCDFNVLVSSLTLSTALSRTHEAPISHVNILCFPICRKKEGKHNTSIEGMHDKSNWTCKQQADAANQLIGKTKNLRDKFKFRNNRIWAMRNCRICFCIRGGAVRGKFWEKLDVLRQFNSFSSVVCGARTKTVFEWIDWTWWENSWSDGHAVVEWFVVDDSRMDEVSDIWNVLNSSG